MVDLSKKEWKSQRQICNSLDQYFSGENNDNLNNQLQIFPRKITRIIIVIFCNTTVHSFEACKSNAFIFITKQPFLILKNIYLIDNLHSIDIWWTVKIYTVLGFLWTWIEISPSPHMAWLIWNQRNFEPSAGQNEIARLVSVFEQNLHYSHYLRNQLLVHENC